MERDFTLKEMQIEAACLKFALTLLPNLAFVLFMLFTLALKELVSVLLGEGEMVYTITLKKVWTDYVPAIVVIVNFLSVFKNIAFSFLKNPKWVKRLIYTNYFDEAICLVGIAYCIWLLIIFISSLSFHLGFLILYLIIGIIGGFLVASFIKSMKWNNKIIKACDSFCEKEGESVGNFKEN